MSTFFVHIFSYHKACSKKLIEITKLRNFGKYEDFWGKTDLFFGKKYHIVPKVVCAAIF